MRTCVCVCVRACVTRARVPQPPKVSSGTWGTGVKVEGRETGKERADRLAAGDKF